MRARPRRAQGSPTTGRRLGGATAAACLVAALAWLGGPGCGGGAKKPPLGIVSQGESLEQSSLRAALRGDLPRALVLEEQALAAYRSVDDTRAIAGAANRVGNLRQWTGDRQGAQGAYGEALELARVAGHAAEEAAALNNLGTLLEESGELAGAELRYREAWAVARGAEAPQTLATVLSNRALLAARSGDLETAERLLGEALELDREGGASAGEATRLRNLGRIQDRRGRSGEAIASLERALRLDQAGEDIPAIAADLVALSEARAGAGRDLTAAISERGRAAYIHRSIGAQQMLAADQAAIQGWCRRLAAEPASAGDLPADCARWGSAAAPAPAATPAPRRAGASTPRATPRPQATPEARLGPKAGGGPGGRPGVSPRVAVR